MRPKVCNLLFCILVRAKEPCVQATVEREIPSHNNAGRCSHDNDAIFMRRPLDRHSIQAEYLQNKIKGIATDEYVVILHSSSESADHETDIMSKHCSEIYLGHQPSNVAHLYTYRFQRPV